MSRLRLYRKIKNITFTLVLLMGLLIPFESISADHTPPPSLVSESAILIDSNSGEVLYEKNAHQPMYPASITKILTAIIAIETQDLDDVVTVSGNAIRAIGTRVYLLEDEQITIGQLLHGLMVSSGNDAAIAIAEHIDGSVEAFAERMNRFAQFRMGVSDQTNFTNPHGLYEDEHIVTAADMAKISSYAMKNETFRELVGTHYYDWVGEGWETRLFNHHPLLRSEENIIGIKNGFVRLSGYTLSTAAKVDDTELIAVTLQAPSRNYAQRDTLALLRYGFDNFETQWISFEKEPLLVQFVFPDPIAVTTKKGEEINYSISNSGYVTITGEENRKIDGFQLKHRELLQLPRFSLNPVLSATVPIEEQENNHWTDWLVISGFYFFNRN
ncbi:D-alanyl-D-alanine carboxypeptidase/D-alanyl-D-alanine carboxypeptidase (penicillin-binding protein 5/6) [Evansella vedderi]|uniref:D-alanyl-D-alanine carboxypeptidase/D-alanyl-D-alanine carboxypeptidase (Penicillin-binding protein 5/6) n=1 Tax=Evansella vedderi TaxID=38282 RepID=A0ABT9ZWE2_9BACI|nr:D-alanyl-D-alanine carboxypeptidase family protein [Evansella vedderi]MDQ0255189.1 D-alanyl-D-alanine carboxypeptidase/D-alanyl-D-alanine carboxypeptidase (penicillin-binding protein 5/6) [Evansella vedderi]